MAKKRIGKYQITVSLCKTFDPKRWDRKDIADHQREQRVLARVLKSKLFSVTGQRQWKSSVGTTFVTLTLEAVELMN
jgi:hypothetical protein